MELRQAQRNKTRIKMAIQGPSGSGKTKSSLLLAYGLCGSWEQIAVIDTENNSADLYADLGRYMVLSLKPPYSPEKYIEAIDLCESKGMAVVIVDSITHEWEGMGGILDIHSNMTGNSFTNWNKITPRHNAFIQSILQSHIHIIATIRSKQDYVLTERNGKQVPEKVGLKPITREGTDYEFTVVFDLDIRHYASVSKDRTGLFMGKPVFRIDIETGKSIREWCNIGQPVRMDFSVMINSCKTVEQLLDLYMKHPQYQQSYLQQFTNRRMQMMQDVQNVQKVPDSPYET